MKFFILGKTLFCFEIKNLSTAVLCGVAKSFGKRTSIFCLITSTWWKPNLLAKGSE